MSTQQITRPAGDVRLDAAEFRSLMGRAKFTQRGLAEASGVNVNTILALFHGRQVPHPETLARLVGAINPVLGSMGEEQINPVDLYITDGFPKGEALSN